MKRLLLVLITLLTFVACNERRASTAKTQARATEKMVAEANRRVGLPNITNFTEKRFVKMLYELRDKEVTTFSYYLDMNGKRHFLCESIGYGIPAAVQYVNPEKLTKADCGQYCNEVAMPQPEPNGLFMPDSLSATYVMCVNPKTGKASPVYFEPPLIVSPFKF